MQSLEDKKRAKGQTDRILEALGRGARTNTELAEIALKYTSRISDARKRGYSISCHHLGGGLTLYQLV